MNLGKRIELAFELCGVRAPQVSRSTGVPVQSINALIRRDSKRSEYTEQLLSALSREKVDHNWVRTGQGTPEPKQSGSTPKEEQSRVVPITTARSIQPAQSNALEAAPYRAWEYPETLPDGGGWVFIPRLGIIPSAGPGGTEAIKTVHILEEVQAFRADWVRDDQLKPASLAWSLATDGSMENTIYEGDSYVTDLSDVRVVDGKVYNVWYGGQERPRRLFQLPGGGLRVAPESDKYQAIDLSPEDARKLRIIGRVVHRAGRGGL